MYAYLIPRRGRTARPSLLLLTALAAVHFAGVSPVVAQHDDWAADQQGARTRQPASVIRNISRATERIEMTVNTSQVLTLQNPIPRIQVTNPELLTATPLSKNEVQVAARQSGVTQVNLWDERGQIYTVDIIIYGDVRELDMTLKQMFPESSIRAVRLSQSLVLQGQVDRPEIVPTISQLAADYAPKVINAITVGGVQQITLKVKVMEVSRTKLRTLGVDWALFSGNDFVASSVSDIIQTVSATAGTATGQGQTFSFGVVDGGSTFLGFIEALEQNTAAKILADPILTTVSGRPASFNVGGELPILVPSGLGQTTIEYKKFGTQVDFVPLVLGDGNIRLEVRPRVSEIDDTRSVTVNSFTVPALKVREVDTGVEMKAGQTLALAGLVQERVDSVKRGLPFVGDLPIVGIPFRRIAEEVNEIELLIMVTPEFVDAMDPHEVPQCGPGMETVSPSYLDFYCKGHIESPACGPCGPGMACGCNDYGCAGCRDHSVYGSAASGPAMAPAGGPYMPMHDGPVNGEAFPQAPEMVPVPYDGGQGGGALLDPTASSELANPYYTAQRPVGGDAVNPAYRHILNGQSQPGAQSQIRTSTPGLIGPIGYDVQQ